ncbi:PROTEASE DO-LIKE 2 CHLOROPLASTIC [Salix purpurea]|uniref:PROTEASE DO-LIKE 2 CHLOROPLASTIC n=1 Tax=Salix purpurea TaxID=77065 RepID=A0A9Q0P291_SALPP|nr:PROTEASE DO-LIKE 2 CHLOROPLASTIC [Salix purpurea]
MLQKLENPALRACLKVQSNEGVLVRRVEPTSDANRVLKEGDVIVSFDDVHVGCEGTVPFRSNERIAFRYLISQKFAGDVAELGIIRAGSFMKVQAVLNPRVHLVPYHVDGGQPSYLIIAGLVFTPLSEPLIEEECEGSIGLKLLAKSRYSLARFKGEQIVILSQVLANEVNFGYEDMSNQQAEAQWNSNKKYSSPSTPCRFMQEQIFSFSSLKTITLLCWRGKQRVLVHPTFSKIMEFHLNDLLIYQSHMWTH